MTLGHPSGDKLKEAVKRILEQNKLLTLATCDEYMPHVSTAYYVYDADFNLYIWTDPNTKHGLMIEKNSSVALNIADTTQEWGALLKGLQLFGTCRQLSLAQAIIPANLYIKRFPKVKSIIANPIDVIQKYESRIYKIEISHVKIFDEEAFGKETWYTLNFHKRP